MLKINSMQIYLPKGGLEEFYKYTYLNFEDETYLTLL